MSVVALKELHVFINKVRLVNFCQHIDKTIEFGSGLNVIVGPNGSGKSNILNGIYGCLTGDFGRNAGKTSDNISIRRMRGASSYIDLQFSHGGNSMQLMRSLDPIERKFTVGGNTYTADKEVSDKMTDILEVGKDILNQYVFVEQWDHFGPMDLAPAKRAKAFSKLFGIDQLTRIGEELAVGSVKLASVNIGIYDVVSLAAQLKEMTALISSTEATLATMPNFESMEADMTKANKTLYDWRRKQSLNASVTSNATTLQAISEEKAKYLHSVTELNTELLNTHEHVCNMQDSNDYAKQIETEWVKYEYYLASKKSIDTKIADLSSESSRYSEPVKPEGYVESIDSLTKELDAVKFKHEQHKQFMSSIDITNDSATCPTCGTPAKSLADRWEKCKEESEDLFNQMSVLSKVVSDIARYERANASYSMWLNGYNKRVTETTNAAASLVVEVEPTLSRKEALAILVLFKDLNFKLVNVAKQISKLDTECSRLDGMTTQIEATLNKELDELLKYDGIDETTVDEAQASVVRIKNSKTAINLLNTNLAVNKSVLKAINDKIIVANDQIRLAEISSGWNDRIDNLKKVYKATALPTVVSYRYMDRVVTELNKTLSDIGLPFIIELEPDLSFVANFGYHKVPAARLSGGQKIMLTIAYRLAVNFTFATNLGLLCLDEPTVGLDEANLGALEKAFERLSQFSSANGVQVIVVTHEKGISHLFDHTIDLTKV